MQALLLLIPFWALSAIAVAQDGDADGLPDQLEAQLGMDSGRADAFELLYDDKSGAEGDETIGREVELAGDFTKVWFCAAARDRYVWKVEFTKPWIDHSQVALILYVDADNNRDTGRRDKEWAQGVDMMLRPDSAQMFEWPAVVKATSAADGNVLYLVADIKLNQQDGKSVYRWTLLTQNTTQGREQDHDNMPWLTAEAAGRSDAPRVAVEPSHPLYHPPELISHLAARVVPDAPEPTAEVTWITSWPCNSRVEYGPTADLGQTIEAEPAMQNHRLLIPVEAGRTYRFRATCDSADEEPKQSEVVSLETRIPRVRGSVKRDEVPLTIANEANDALEGAPFLVGVPFPPGALGSVGNLRVLQDGREVPLQTECMARWPDGSVKWAQVQFLADCPAKSQAEVLLAYGSAVRRELAEPPPMVEVGDGILVCNTGPLEAIIDTEEFNLFRSLRLDLNDDGDFTDDEELIGVQDPGGLYLVDASGKEYRAGKPEEVTVEENGPVRAVVKLRGHHVAQDGSRLFEYIVRLMLYRGQGQVRILHTFGSDNVGQGFTDIARLGIRLPMEYTDQAMWMTMGTREKPDGGTGYGAVAVVGHPARMELRQMHHERFELVAGDERGGDGSEGVAADCVLLRDRGMNLLCDVVDLREQYPKGWLIQNNTLDVQLCPPLRGDEYANADPVTSDRLYYYLRDGAYRFRAGVTKTHQIALHLAAGAEPPPSLWAMRAHDPLNCHAPPEWYAKTGAAGLMTPRVEGEFTEYETFVERNFDAFQKRREELGEYGMLNFGDWWGERGYNWGNVEYDTQHVMLMEYLRTLDRKFLKRGCEAALHNRDVDGIHYAPTPRDVGQVHVHCMFHTGDYEVTGEQGQAFPTGGFNRGHVWTRGLLDHYFLTGDRRSRDWALKIADYLAGPMTVGFSVGNHAERDTAWPIFGVMAAYEATADPYYLNAARLMVEDVIRRQNPETGNWGFPAGYSQVEPKPIGGYAWCCGLLISALDQYNQYARDPRVDEVIVRAARWLVRDEWIPEKRGFRATSCPTFNESTPPGGACWSCANAMLIAHKLTREQQFLDIARCGFSSFLQGTQAMGKGVTQSICLGPETLWRFKQAGVTSLDPAPYLPAGSAAIPRHLLLWSEEEAALPVVLTSNRDEAVATEVRIAAAEGLRVEPEARNAQLTDKGHDERLLFPIRSTEPLQPGKARHLTVKWRIEDLTGEQSVEVIRPEPITVGTKVGLIASGDDYLGPALDELGVEYERLSSLDETGGYRALLLGTQAHSINTLGLLDGYWRLFPWVRAGGTLFCSQLNDTGWERFFLPYEVIVQELDGETGAIANPGHPIFTQPRKITDVSGVKMYDTLRVIPDDPWSVLLRDAEGTPAIIEGSFGKGKVIVMQPSFERVVTGAEKAPDAAEAQALFESILAYVTR